MASFALSFSCVTVCFSIRILPHTQNSGGFFVAVLHKKYSLRDVQNSTPKLPVTVCGPTSDESTNQAAVTQNDSAVLDHTCTDSEPRVDHTSAESEPNALDSATVPTSGTSQQPVADKIIHSGWFYVVTMYYGK